jgi:hypothetical protein
MLNRAGGREHGLTGLRGGLAMNQRSTLNHPRLQQPRQLPTTQRMLLFGGGLADAHLKLSRWVPGVCPSQRKIAASLWTASDAIPKLFPFDHACCFLLDLRMMLIVIALGAIAVDVDHVGQQPSVIARTLDLGSAEPAIALVPEVGPYLLTHYRSRGISSYDTPVVLGVVHPVGRAVRLSGETPPVTDEVLAPPES